MKYKKFTPNRGVYFYDSEFKYFPQCYKYVQYNNRGNVGYEAILDTQINELCRIIFDADNNKNERYRLAEPTNGFYSNRYYFDENFDFLKYV